MVAFNTANAERRDRLLVAAVWLIALGSVFLIKDLAGWEWAQAWPLFVILVGVGSAASTLLGRHWSGWGIWAIWWPLAIIAIGVVLLASTTGMIDIAPAELISWWPIVIVGIGAWFLLGALLVRPPAPAEALSVPLAGATTGDVRIAFGGGEMTIGQAPPGVLLGGRFEGGVAHRLSGPGQLEIKPQPGSWPMWDRPLRWDFGISAEIPVDLRLESGANRSKVDLVALRIRRLELHTGASETRIRLPASGVTTVHVEAGLAQVTLDVPGGVAARVRSKVALGSTSVDEARFPRAGEGWQSPDYDTAPNRVDIDFEGGLGSVRVA